jgi:hypothetical protein
VFVEATNWLADLGTSALVILPGLPIGLLVFGIGLLVARGVDMQARVWIDPPRRREAVDALDGAVEAVKNALSEAGVDLPYPTSQVLFHAQTEETDVDRARQSEGWPARGREVPRSRFAVLEKAWRTDDWRTPRQGMP